MNPNETCYLFFDLDGTVYLQGKIPEENLRAMKAAQNRGHKLILHTGRSYASLLETGAEKAVPWDGMILGTADLRFGGKILEQNAVSEQECYIWLAYCLRHRATITFGGADTLLTFRLGKHPDPFSEAECNEYREILKAWLDSEPATKLTIRGVLDQTDLPVSALTVIQLDTYADLFPSGFDKGTAIQRFCKLLGISLSQCVCFGDSENDVAMFRVCPTSVCMNTAPAELSALATYHAKTEFGVAEGLHTLFGV